MRGEGRRDEAQRPKVACAGDGAAQSEEQHGASRQLTRHVQRSKAEARAPVNDEEHYRFEGNDC